MPLFPKESFSSARRLAFEFRRVLLEGDAAEQEHVIQSLQKKGWR
jgi:hypothetical protein